MLQTIEQAKIGEVVPVYKVIEGINALDLFSKLSNYGKNKNTLLFEFNNAIIGSADPCLKLKGNKEGFEITALNNLGRKFLTFLKGDFKFSDKVQYGQNKITGTLKQIKKNISEDQKLQQKNHMDVIRQIAFKFKPTLKPFLPYCGLFGAFSYDFIEHFEDLPETEDNEPYYEFYFLDNLFVTKEDKTYFIANALIMDDKKEKTYNECLKTIESYEKVLKKKLPKIKKFKAKEHLITTDTEKEEFELLVQKIKKNILEGTIYQAFPSRTIISNYNAEPFDIYKQLRTVKKQFMFYINSDETLLGATSEINLEVTGKEEKIVEVRAIAAKTSLEDNTDINLENKYEAELKTNFREIEKHIMAIDLIRSDVARISKLGTRHLDKIFVAKKYPDEQHLFSSVKGTLKEDLDALHAYISCINRLSGCPKIPAIKLLRQLEKNNRNFFTGTVCYINPDKDFYGAVIKNSIILKNKKANIGVNAGVFYDTTPSNVFNETEKNTNFILEAIKSAGGLK